MGGRERVCRAAAWTLAALVVVLITAGVAAGPANAAGPSPGPLLSPSAGPVPGGPTAVGTVPPQVRAAYDGEFLRRMVTSTQGQVGQVRAGTVHQLFTFTEAFMEGDTTADPVEAGDAWIAGVEADGVPVGWQQTFLDDSGAVQSSGWNPDPVGAQAFLSTTAGALVQVPWDNAFFTLVDGVVTPVKVQSWDAGLGPRDLAQVQADFAVSRAETAAAYACCSGGGDGGASCGPGLPSPGVLALAGVATLLVAGVGWTAVRQRRTRTGEAVTSR